MITRHQPGGHIMNVKCSDGKLKGIVVSLINNYNDLFSFEQLMSDLCYTLDSKDCFVKEPNTIYKGGYKLSQIDSDKIQKMVWEMIWDRQLMLDLYNDEYRYSSDRVSFRLIKVKQ